MGILAVLVAGLWFADNAEFVKTTEIQRAEGIVGTTLTVEKLMSLFQIFTFYLLLAKVCLLEAREVIKRPSGLSRHYTDTTLHQYECGEYSALAAWWITNQGLNDDHPVYIVTLITKHWSHTVCEGERQRNF